MKMANSHLWMWMVVEVVGRREALREAFGRQEAAKETQNGNISSTVSSLDRTKMRQFHAYHNSKVLRY